MENIKVWTGEAGDYRLLDCGDKLKLEEVGGAKIVRAEPRAWWQKSLLQSEWATSEKNLETVTSVGVGGIKAKIKFKPSSKHIGIFPEQAPEWRFIKDTIEKEVGGNKREVNVLNLFGYTGVASLVAAQARAKVTHVDASKQSVEWARENQKLSGLENTPIRWIVEDVLKFIKKERKHGRKYDCLIMDPPSYGKGPKGEVWKIEEKLPELLQTCRELLSDKPLFVIFNMYSTELSSLSIGNILADMTTDLGGTLTCGELALKQHNSSRLLPMSIFALWSGK